MSRELQSLVFLRFADWLTKSGTDWLATVLAYTTTLDTNQELDGLVFEEPVAVKAWEKDRCTSHESGGDAVYDRIQNEVLFTCWGTWPGSSTKKVPKLWHIGPHMAFVGSEDTNIEGFVTSTLAGPLPPSLSVILASGSPNVATAARNASKTTGKIDPRIARKGENGSWSSTMIRGNPEFFGGHTSKLICAPAENPMYIHYIFNERYKDTVDIKKRYEESNIIDSNRVDLYSLRQSYFSNIFSKDAPSWQHFKVDLGFPSLRFKALVVNDDLNSRHRLYFFTLAEPGKIIFSYLPLRTDGSVDSNTERVACIQGGAISLPTKPRYEFMLSGVVWNNKKVILVFQTLEGENVAIGTVETDGSLPASGWKVSQIIFKDGTFRAGFRQAGLVIVDPGFI